MARMAAGVSARASALSRHLDVAQGQQRVALPGARGEHGRGDEAGGGEAGHGREGLGLVGDEGVGVGVDPDLHPGHGGPIGPDGLDHRLPVGAGRTQGDGQVDVVAVEQAGEVTPEPGPVGRAVVDHQALAEQAAPAGAEGAAQGQPDGGLGGARARADVGAAGVAAADGHEVAGPGPAGQHGVGPLGAGGVVGHATRRLAGAVGHATRRLAGAVGGRVGAQQGGHGRQGGVVGAQQGGHGAAPRAAAAASPRTRSRS